MWGWYAQQAAGPASFLSLASGAALQAKQREAEKYCHLYQEEKRRNADMAHQLAQAQVCF